MQSNETTNIIYIHPLFFHSRKIINKFKEKYTLKGDIFEGYDIINDEKRKGMLIFGIDYVRVIISESKERIYNLNDDINKMIEFIEET